MRRIAAADGLSLEAPDRVLDLDTLKGSREAAGPKEIATVLFEEQRLSVYRYLVSLGLRPQVAGEITQDSFLRLYRHLRSKGSNDNLRGWVFRVAHNLAMNELKRTPITESAPPDSEIDPGVDPEEALLRKERVRQLKTAIQMLPRRQQQCLHLRAQGLRYREISQVLGIGISSVAESVQRALTALARTCHEQAG